MFAIGDKVRVVGNPDWKADVMAGVTGMIGTVTGITATSILMEDSDGMEWAWKPACLEFVTNKPNQHQCNLS